MNFFCPVNAKLENFRFPMKLSRITTIMKCHKEGYHRALAGQAPLSVVNGVAWRGL